MVWIWQGYGEDEIRAAFQASRQAGVTFFDTAEVYGLGRSDASGKFIRESGEKVV